MTESPSARCLNCSSSENERPLVSVRYAGRPIWICATCMPVLIHHGDRIEAKLGAGPGK
jgi:hypothetical protein